MFNYQDKYELLFIIHHNGFQTGKSKEHATLDHYKSLVAAIKKPRKHNIFLDSTKASAILLIKKMLQFFNCPKSLKYFIFLLVTPASFTQKRGQHKSF